MTGALLMDKVAVIIEPVSRIGRAIALEFARHGERATNSHPAGVLDHYS
ncbi:MAG: hypothetical protein ACRDTG_13185 [Pseudonocardiaceae bacterium]